jgi:hypothetical protein
MTHAGPVCGARRHIQRAYPQTGAMQISLVPQFAPEEPAERQLRHRILDETGLPYVWIELGPSWRVPGDRHPDARAAHAMPIAIAARLQGR